jgi:hypothetical protein
MPTLLLTDERDSTCVISRRSRARELFVTWFRTWNLDMAIAGGACPDSAAALSLRANRLISRPTRLRLSRAIRRLTRDAQHPPRRIHESVPICWRKVARSTSTLAELADHLSSPYPVEARGVAQVQLLLRSGSSPLYSRPHADDLEEALETAIEALEPVT